MRKFLLDKVVRSKLPARMLADIQTALKDAITLSGVSQTEVDEAEKRFATERGRFIPTIHVQTVNVQDDDPMAEYYSSQPNRYPEIRE